MVNIRPESADDIDAIYALHAASFATSAEAHLVNALRNSPNLVLSLVADTEDDIAGHVAFSAACAPQGVKCAGLGPVAVSPRFRRRGIAERLIRTGISICADRSYAFVVVLGDPGYYARFGFLPASTWGLRDEYQGGSAFQALELRPGGIPMGGGLVKYAPEFEEIGARAT